MTTSFPKEKLYGLVSQMRRSALSIPSNIAEGAGRNFNPDFKRFLSISFGSAYELYTQLLVSKELGYINGDEAKALTDEIDEIQKMNYKLQSTLSK